MRRHCRHLRQLVGIHGRHVWFWDAALRTSASAGPDPTPGSDGSKGFPDPVVRSTSWRLHRSRDRGAPPSSERRRRRRPLSRTSLDRAVCRVANARSRGERRRRRHLCPWSSRSWRQSCPRSAPSRCPSFPRTAPPRSPLPPGLEARCSSPPTASRAAANRPPLRPTGGPRRPSIRKVIVLRRPASTSRWARRTLVARVRRRVVRPGRHRRARGGGHLDRDRRDDRTPQRDRPYTHAGALAQVIRLGYNFDLKPDDVSSGSPTSAG
jgi:hypothetical protein